MRARRGNPRRSSAKLFLTRPQSLSAGKLCYLLCGCNIDSFVLLHDTANALRYRPVFLMRWHADFKLLTLIREAQQLSSLLLLRSINTDSCGRFTASNITFERHDNSLRISVRLERVWKSSSLPVEPPAVPPASITNLISLLSDDLCGPTSSLALKGVLFKNLSHT